MLQQPRAQPTLWGHDSMTMQPLSACFEPLDPESAVLHQSRWLQGADAALDELIATVPWQSQRRVMYGQLVEVPRLSISVDPDSLSPCSTLGAIVLGVGDLIGAPIEHVGLNYYRSGADSVAWHRDRIGAERDWSVVALVSLGGPRRLGLRPFRRRLEPHGGSPRRVTLHSGDLFVMAGACQRDWEHTIGKSVDPNPRISIVVRTRQFPHGPLFQQRRVTSWDRFDELE